MDLVSFWCERQTASFTKRFKKRYVTFDQSSRQLSYAENEHKPPKGVMVITKVVRLCQIMEVKTSELLTLLIDGKRQDGSEDQWTLRMPSRQVFDEWTRIFWTACASAGLMEPFNASLPPVDPRTNLPFAQLPLEDLFRFAVLEKAVVYFFDSVTLMTPTPVKDHQLARGRFVVGDKAIYIFTKDAVVAYCTLIRNICKIYHSPDATFFAVCVKPPAPDIVVKDFGGGVQLVSILSRLFERTTNESLSVMPINVPTVEVLVESEQLRLEGGEGYKLHIVSPTNKARLQQTLEATSGGMGTTTQAEATTVEKGRQRAGGESFTATCSSSEATDPLTMFLSKIGLQAYAPTLLNQHVDLDVLLCMDASDLMTFGIKDEAHCKRILDATLGVDTATLAITDDDALSPALSLKTAPPVTAPDRGVVVLSDDDDDDICLSSVPPRGAVVLDDDSDEELLFAPSAAASRAKPLIVFDDDDL